MQRAIAAATPHRPHPNPRVGAVILGPDGTRLAEGAHAGPGQPHAEVVALSGVSGALPAGSTLVVTLEPCNHHGRTPPCTDAILAGGIARVVVGAVDPDPQVAGSGLARLTDAGVEIETGLLADEVTAMDPAYFHHRLTGRARFLLKTAVTLDGQTAARDNTSQWITSPEARQDGHRLRAEADAVMVGAGTLRSDDPSLTVRLDGYDGPQPVPVVVAGHTPLPGGLRLWDRSDTLVFSVSPVAVGGTTVIVPPTESGLPDLGAVAVQLGDRGLLSVLVEGGSRLFRGLWDAGLVDAGVTYLGAKLAGGTGLPVFSGPWATLADARPITVDRVGQVGPDVRLDWSLERYSLGS